MKMLLLCSKSSTVINVLEICDDVIIGAGSTVITNVSRKGTYVGVVSVK